MERIRSQFVALRDGHVETTVDDTEIGVGLHVVRDGSFGFAATVELNADAAARLADDAAGLAARDVAGPRHAASSWPTSPPTARCGGRRPTRWTPRR